MNTIEEKAVLDSMKKVLDKINEKLQDDEILGDIKIHDSFQRRKKLVEKHIEDWQIFMNQ